MVVLGILGAVLWGLVGKGGGGEKSADGAEPGQTSGLAGLSYEEQAKKLVQDYMDALAAKDPAKALELSGQPGEGTTALSPEAYQQALEAAPITDVKLGVIQLDEGGLATAKVPVIYSVGGQQTDQELSLHDYDDDGQFELVAGVGVRDQFPDRLKGLGATLNGAEVPDDTEVLLLPGAYTVATPSEYLTFSADSFTVTNDGAWPLGELDLAVNDAAKQAFREAVLKAVDACLAEKTLAAGCGLDPVPSSATDGWTASEGTVTRTLSEVGRREIEKMEPTPGHSEPLLLEGSHISGYDYTVECTKDGQTAICEPFIGGSFGRPSVDLSEPALPVFWG